MVCCESTPKEREMLALFGDIGQFYGFSNNMLFYF